MTTIRAGNFASLEPALAAAFDTSKEVGGVVWMEDVSIQIVRPLERHGAVVLSDPFAEIIKLFRVPMLGDSPPDGFEPWLHLSMRTLRGITPDTRAVPVDIVRRTEGMTMRVSTHQLHMQLVFGCDGMLGVRSTMLYMSMVQEIIAVHLGCGVGLLSLHLDKLSGNVRDIVEIRKVVVPAEPVSVSPMVDKPIMQWAAELDMWRKNGLMGGLPSIRHVFCPMLEAWRAIQDGDTPMRQRLAKAAQHTVRCQAEDWRTAGLRWIGILGEVDAGNSTASV